LPACRGRRLRCRSRTAGGRFLGRPDLYYPAQRLGLEYDGGTHRAWLAEDNRHQNRLLAAGYRLLRFTAGDVLRTPDLVVAQVRAALRAA
jgi:very-short-patch-repair endonuclease